MLTVHCALQISIKHSLEEVNVSPERENPLHLEGLEVRKPMSTKLEQMTPNGPLRSPGPRALTTLLEPTGRSVASCSLE